MKNENNNTQCSVQQFASDIYDFDTLHTIKNQNENKLIKSNQTLLTLLHWNVKCEKQQQYEYQKKKRRKTQHNRITHVRTRGFECIHGRECATQSKGIKNNIVHIERTERNNRFDVSTFVCFICVRRNCRSSVFFCVLCMYVIFSFCLIAPSVRFLSEYT